MRSPTHAAGEKSPSMSAGSSACRVGATEYEAVECFDGEENESNQGVVRDGRHLLYALILHSRFRGKTARPRH
jgi:hypothetical protein